MSAGAPFADIVGQPRATGALERALRTGRLFPSLLFHGPGGVGKLATAIALARAIACTAEAAHRPCRACRSCRQIDDAALHHPGVRVVFPESRKAYDDEMQGKADTERLPDLQARQAETRDHSGWSILIDRIRDTIAFLHRLPAVGSRSVVIIDQANRMDPPAANALLKILEEPPSHAVLVLTASSPHAVIPTLRSRCQPVAFQPVSATGITNFLVETRGLGPEEAVLRAGQADGRIGAALAIDLDDFRRRREAVLALLEELLGRGDAGIAVARAETFAKGGGSLERDLDLLQTLVRDLVLLEAAADGPPAPRLTHLDLKPRLAVLAGRLGRRGPDAVAAVESARQGIRHNGNRQMLVETLFLDLLPRAAPRPAAP
jgi:DNA polymerase-3 subunit delta'